MTTSGVLTGVKCRRKHKRYVLPKEWAARVEFDFPRPGGHRCSMQLKDLSAGGLCFVLAHDLPGLDVGESIDQVTLMIAGQRVAGDLFVMHLSPDAGKGSLCGAFFYPAGDDNLLAIQALVADLEHQWPQNANERRRWPR